MSGRAERMVSPSSSSSRRSTPCVEGCCGPMFSVMRRARVSTSGDSAGGPAVTVTPGMSPSLMRSNSGTRYRIVLAQRMPFPILRQHDASELGMIAEADPKQVEHLALVPVGPAPDRCHGIDLWMVTRHPAFQPHPLVALQRVQVIDHLEAWLLGIPVDARHGAQSRKLLLVLQVPAHADDSIGRDFEREFSTIVLPADQRSRRPFAK